MVGQHASGADDAEAVEEVGTEECATVGMKPYSRADAEALRVLEAVLFGGAHAGCGQHVHYWLSREWAVLRWKHNGEGRGQIDLRISNAGMREVTAWRKRRMHA
jgi:hypothetical protein